MPLPLAAAISGAVAFAAWRARTLTPTGAIAAWSVGLLVLWGTGWAGGAVVAVFFVSSNLVSRIGAPRTPAGLDPKGDRRDLRQVYANGGVAAIGALAGLADISLGIWLVTTTLAAAAADTWATSMGARSRIAPRLMAFGPTVLPGTSGGMTLVGSAAAAAGALVVAATGAASARMPLLLPAATLIGFAGMVTDSALGAFLQGRFHCPRCDELSEWRVHRCGTPTIRRGGFSWLDNDWVNFLATVFAAGAGLAVRHWLSSPA